MKVSEEEKEAIEIVKEFNKENKFRDCGRLNNAIDIVIRMAEERNKYNITTRPVEKIKEDIEQNKNIFIFGKEYICKDKIRQILDITATVLGDNYEMDFIDVRDAVADAITAITRNLLEGD